jgi:hypothetical protein
MSSPRVSYQLSICITSISPHSNLTHNVFLPNLDWDEYLAGFEQKSQQYMTEMQQTHKQQLDSLRENLTHEIENKPKKWSRDLMDCRKSLENVAKQASTGRPSVSHTQLYREAQQIKQVTDALHEKEEADMNSKFSSVLSAKVRNLEKKQQAEKAALMKRIETKRREVTKKREEDMVRLVQRNRNIVKMLDAKNVSPISVGFVALMTLVC